MIYVLGGGVGTLYACIGVTYPSGSTCTCSNGTKTLTAKGTSGTAIFNVPSTGTWTVTATNGYKTASKSVSITAEGQAVVVSLASLELYNAGTKGVEFSEGKAGNTAGTVTWGDSTITLYAKAVTNINHMGVTYIYPTSVIDLSDYKTLKAYLPEAYGTGTHFALNITSSVPSFTAGDPVPTNMTARSIYDDPTSGLTAELDITDINSGYVCIEVWTTNQANTNVTAVISSIVLEA